MANKAFLKSALVTACLFMMNFVHAQSFSYDFFVLNRNWEYISDSVSLNEGMTWDDPLFIIPLPFDFQLLGESIDTIYCDPFGLGAFFGTRNDFSGTGNMFIAYGSDLIDRAFDFENGEGPGSLSPYSYAVTGDAPDRIVKIEIRNAGFYNTFADNVNDDQFINLQIWLYESDFSVEVVFGPKNITNPSAVFDGESGTFIGMLPNFNYETAAISAGTFFLAGPALKPSLVAVETIENTAFIDGIIPEGTVFRFTPLISHVNSIENAGNLLIYPNPASEFLFLQQTPNEGFIGIEILDLSGRKLFESNSDTNRIDVSSFKSGVYLLRYFTSKGLVSRRFVKN